MKEDSSFFFLLFFCMKKNSLPNYKKSKLQGMIYILTENRPATVILSGERRAVASRSLNRRPAAVVNKLSPARSKGGGSLILAVAVLPPNCHLPDILGCHVSRKPVKINCNRKAAFSWQLYVTALSDV